MSVSKRTTMVKLGKIRKSEKEQGEQSESSSVGYKYVKE